MKPLARSARPLAGLALLCLGGVPAGAQSVGGATPTPAGSGIHFPQPAPGTELPKPGGGTFFADAHRRGGAPSVHLLATRWGRLVDVHGLDGSGALDPEPVFRDFVIDSLIQSDGANYRLLQSPVTHLERLVILRVKGAPDTGNGTFESLLTQATTNLPQVLPKGPGDPPPFSFVPRNGVLMLSFDDLLDDSSPADLFSTVRLAVGQPELPFEARVLFDPNHGGLMNGAFHSTRVLVDFTVSGLEASELPLPLGLNELGLPASAPASALSSALLRLPTQVAPGSGQFVVLTNLRGRALALSGNGPVDLSSPSLDVVRAMRAGNGEDANNGFLLDLARPALLGSFPCAVNQAVDDAAGDPGFSFRVSWVFGGPCRAGPRTGDVLSVGSHTLEVTAGGALPDPGGQVLDVPVRLVGRSPSSPAQLLGQGLLTTPYRPGALDPACWIRFVPQPAAPPSARVSPTSQVQLRFSEPMLPSSLRPFDSLRLVRGPSSQPADPLGIVVAQIVLAPDGSDLTLAPALPLEHLLGNATPYHLELAGGNGPTDLAGNGLAIVPADIEFTLDPLAATENTGGLVLRFEPDELPGPGTDLRGQLFYDLSQGTIRGRPATYTGFPADNTNPIPSLMIPYPPGVQTPLSPLGSKLQTVWRYADLGWNVRDETKYNVDVVGLSWVPPSGLVVADFYPQFEIALAHSNRLPDEKIDINLLPRWPDSGLRGAPSPYGDNVLVDPLSPQTVVHPRAQGYTVTPTDVFVASNGTVMMPFPLNRGGGPLATYTWRDTAVLARSGPNGAGIPMGVEVGPPLFLETQSGVVAASGDVPSFGLPLLLEYRCFTSNFGLGLNALAANLALNSSSRPNFREYSTGGVNSSGQVVTKDPDLELVPSGGFNPSSTPPGLPSPPQDNLFYRGQLDVVYRISRAHSVWIDLGAGATHFVQSFTEQTSPDQSQILVEFRGASDFAGPDDPFDAQGLDPYGDLPQGGEQFVGPGPAWTGTPSALDGARYLQLRISFVNDVVSGASPLLDSFALAFTR